MATDSLHSISTTDATFAADVIERSRQLPVVVDFWASWCQPCMMLKPVLEKLAEEYAGRFLLVKAETEQNQSAAGQFNVSSIPAVFAVIGGEVVDYFQGALPEAQLRDWIDRLFLQADVQAVIQLEATDPADAVVKYRALLAKLPREPMLQIGLGRALLAAGEVDKVQPILDELEKRGFLEPEAQNLKAALELAGMRGGNVADLAAQAAAEPKNLERQLALAEALAGAGRHEEALQAALAVITAQRLGPGEKARQLMVDIFRVLPADAELTSVYRRKLAAVLF